ncbi:MAG: NACHT domain-containing protein [Anaerolineae bacterium]|nr:NACHT domain-containing protein [Anaerolineae bacterium]
MVEQHFGNRIVIVGNDNIVGDGNAIYKYILDARYRPLAEHLIPFGDLILERTRTFVGRQFLDDRLAMFLATHDRGYFVLAGEPGIGKTAWAAHVVQQYEAVHHFNVVSLGLTRPEQALENLCAQIIGVYKLDHPAHLPLTAGRDGAYLHQLLHQAAPYLAGGRLVLVIDAVDETRMPPDAQGANILYLPSALPVGVYIVLTHRPQPVTLETAPDTPVETFTLSADLPDNQGDVRTYLREQLHKPQVATWLAAQAVATERAAAELAQRSEGNFMYLAYLLADIEAGRCTTLTLRDLPQGLRGYFERFWTELEAVKREGREAWTQFYKPVIGLLAVAQEPVSAAWLGQVLGLDAEEVQDFALVAWRKFLSPLRAGEETRWRIYHGSFVSFLQDKLSGAREYHRRIAEHYLATCAPDWAGCDLYGLKYVVDHIVAARLLVAEQATALDQVLTDAFVAAHHARFAWLWYLTQDLSIVGEVDPPRAASMALKIIEGPQPNSLVIQQSLRLLKRLYTQTGFVGNPRSSRHHTINTVLRLLNQVTPEALSELRAFLKKTKNPRVLSLIALALGETGSREVAAELMHMLKSARREGSWAAADALIALNDHSIVPELLAWYDEGYSHRDRERVLYILGWMRAEDARALLPKALASPDHKVVGRGLDLLWQLPPSPDDISLALSHLERILDSDPQQPKLGPLGDEWVQKRLARVLSRRGSTDMIPYLEQLSAHIARRPPPVDTVKRQKLISSVEEALQTLGR